MVGVQAQEQIGIAGDRLAIGQFFQIEKPLTGRQFLEQRGLAALANTHQRHARKLAEQFMQQGGDVAIHVGIIKLVV